MKKLYLGLKTVLLCILVIHLVSCKKDKDGKEVTPTNEYVEIEGEKYPAVKIGSQIWTTENYRGPGGEPFDNNNSKPQYGKYYSFEEFENIKLPDGWKLPSKEDYIQLAQSQGVVFVQERATKQDAIKKLVSKTGWLNINGNNQSGFNAFPAGYLIGAGSPADGDISEFWTSDRNTFSLQESADQVNHNIVIYVNMENDPSKFNVRFVKK